MDQLVTRNKWQIWKCLKWIPAQNRCNMPQLKKTPVAKLYMTKHDYSMKSKEIKFWRELKAVLVNTPETRPFSCCESCRRLSVDDSGLQDDTQQLHKAVIR